MANKYVYSGAAGGATGADWTNAYTTIKAAAEAAGTAAGDSIWVAHDHAETGAVALSITCKNTQAAPGTIACVDRAGSVPPVAADLRTTATVTTTGNSQITLTGQTDGPTLWHGITFNGGSGAVGSGITLGFASGVNVFKLCSFRKQGTLLLTTAIQLLSRTIMDNCTMQFGNVGDRLAVTGTRSEWLNSPGAIIGSVFPTTLFNTATTGWIEMVLRGVDLSAITGSLLGTLLAPNARDFRLIDCKLAAGVVVSAAQTAFAGGRVTLVNCDSGAANYRTEAYRYGGNQFTETTIVRTGGGSDGTTPVSWRIVTDANPRWQVPFESLPITVWSDSPGAKTVSVYGYWNNASVPNNDDIWIEVEGLTSAGSPLSSIATSGKASFLATNAAIPSDASTWGGGVTTSKFKMSASITTAMKGPISVVVKAAKASSTFYIDPKIEVV